MTPGWFASGFSVFAGLVGLLFYCGRLVQRVDHLESDVKALKEQRSLPKKR
jgi:hypothetical protein